MKKITFLLTITFSLIINNVFAQDSCANAVALTPGTQQCGNTSSGADVYDNSTCLGFYDGGDDYIFSYTATTTGETLTLDLTGVAAWTGFALSNGCPEDGGTYNCLGSATTTAGGAIGFTSDILTAGTTYYIHISTWPAPQSTDFCLDAVVNPAPTCINPANLMTANATTNSVDLSWTDPSMAQYDFEYVIQAAGTGEPTGSGVYVGDLQALAVTTDIDSNPLTSATAYEVWVRATCGGTDGNSEWVGPVNFATLCDALPVPFMEGFNSDSATQTCWTVLNENADGDSWNMDYATNPYEGNQVAALYTDFNAGADDDWLISPTLTLTGNQRLKFHYRVQSAGEPNDFEVLLSTAGTDPASFTNVLLPVATYSNITYVEQIIDISSYSGDVNIAWHVPTGSPDGWRVYIDNVIVENIPSTVPPCATNIVATPDAACGNFENEITWDATTGADGYYLTIGTSTGANDILDNQDLGNTTSYSFTGTIGTTYYFTLVPYNAVGPAENCVEEMFATSTNGCYCTSAPTSVDGTGITNVQIVTTDFPNTVAASPVYNDHTATVVDMSQAINNNVQITFNVTSFGTNSYDYNTVIWIDFNDDYNFDATEIVYVGLSPTTASPTLLDASFVMPATAPLGEHRMRIVATDALQNPSNPCYSGTYGETADFTVNIIEASCAPVAIASSTIVPDCANDEFNVEFDVTDLGDGTPTISDGTTSWPITATGVVSVGPFMSGSSVTLTALHGSDTTCDITLGTFTYTCPPVNNDCAAATALTPGGVFADNEVVGTLAGATNSAAPAPGCGSYSGPDVWYSVEVPASGSITIETNSNSSTLTDSGMAVYSGTCGALTLIECDDDDSLDGAFSLVSLTALTPGEILYVVVWEYGGDIQDTFKISAYDASLSANSFTSTGFVAYPNPVKDILNLEYDSEIANVQVINLLGQTVIDRAVNATTTQINMSQLNAGTYLVNVTSNNGIQKTIKVVKQ